MCISDWSSDVCSSDLLMDAFTPPAWTSEGQSRFALGTDDQGRDLLSAIMHGTRISLVVGFAAIVLAIVLGVGLGVLSGYLGGFFETLLMRGADVQLTIPGILVALMVNGAARAALRSYAVVGAERGGGGKRGV